MSSTGPPSPDPAARLGPPVTRRHGTVLVAVGDELLGGFTLDSNSHWLAGRLREAGYPVVRIEVVADRLEDITGAVRRAVADAACDRVVVSGGLGPTTDDRTLEALASALDRPLVTDRAALDHVRALVQRMHAAGWVDSPEPSPANLRMTVVPEGATVLENRRGMAPGLAYPVDPVVDAAQGEPGASTERWLLVLPGVPRELKTLVEEEALPRLFGEGVAAHVVELEYGHAVEADFFEPMRTLEREFPDVAVGSYPQTETRRLVIRLRGADADRVEAAVRRLRSLRPLPGA